MNEFGVAYIAPFSWEMDDYLFNEDVEVELVGPDSFWYDELKLFKQSLKSFRFEDWMYSKIAINP